MLFFKYLLKFHTLIEVGQMLYEGFSNAGLTLAYLNLVKKNKIISYGRDMSKKIKYKISKNHMLIWTI